MKELEKTDPKIAKLIEQERIRQAQGLELIPSENFASKAVLEALGSVLTNKYSEGYPFKRYYGGNQVIDQIEALAIERAKKVFGAEHVNVQPYSGSPANIAVYFGLLNFGDKIMGMNLAHGGHLTHGHKVNFSGKAYTVVSYGVDKKTEKLDYDMIRQQAIKEKPNLIISGYTAYPRTIDFKQFAEIAQEADAISMSDIAHIAGIVAAGLHPSPFPHTDVVTTTTHKTLRGPRGAMIMCKEKFATKIDKAIFPGLQGGPHDHQTAAIAVALEEASQPEFKDYIKQVLSNAKALAGSLTENGLRCVSGGTDNHLILVDLTKKAVKGKEAESALDLAHITVNKNMIPYDTRTPFDPSGIRLGTPALTTRGMKESEMEQIGQWIARVVDNVNSKQVIQSVKDEVIELCKNY